MKIKFKYKDKDKGVQQELLWFFGATFTIIPLIVMMLIKSYYLELSILSLMGLTMFFMGAEFQEKTQNTSNKTK